MYSHIIYKDEKPVMYFFTILSHGKINGNLNVICPCSLVDKASPSEGENRRSTRRRGTKNTAIAVFFRYY